MSEAAKWPKGAGALRALGYKSEGKGSCQSCGAEIIWARTPNGRRMPMVEAEPESADERWFQPHFVDCTEAKKWSKR